MIRKACLSLLPLCLPLSLAAQSPFATTRHAGFPFISVGDKFAAGDLDGDGDLDLFVANDNSANQLLLNDGDGRFTDATIARFGGPLPAEAAHSVDLADIDNDGDLDVLIGNDDNITNRVYQNNGVGLFIDVTAIALPPNNAFTECQVVADFDGDGDVDWFTVDGGPCHFYENDGTGVFTDVSATRLSGLPIIYGNRYDVTPAAVDIDGDGDLDVMVPRYTGTPFLIVNQGGVLMPSATQLPPTISGFAHWFADYDNDGDPDIFLDRGRMLLQNQGNGTFVDVSASAFPFTVANNFACFDHDNDGDLDVIGSAQIWVNNGNGTFSALTASTFLMLSYNLGVASADFDGDGDIDLPGKPNFLRQTFAQNAPVRGAAYSVEFHARPGVTSLVGACGSLGSGILPVGPFGVLGLDPATAASLAVAQVTTGPLTLTWTVPNLPALAGLELDYQALVVDPLDGPLVSNRIRDVVQ